mmetsp:Transcript_6880/g.28188  ORF Transcript_6880/g.28188 Transcript_6880/m.28188 type:complete len:253 (+) Transcript_6880:3307-4065(+)
MTSLCTTSAMKLFISRISSSSFWNIAFALSSSSPRARALWLFRRLRSAAFRAAEARRDADAEDADASSFTVVSSAATSSSSSERTLRSAEVPLPSRVPLPSTPEDEGTLSSSDAPSSAVFDSETPYLYRADAWTRDSALSTARCAGVSSTYRSPRTRSAVSEPVSAGTETSTSSSASALTLTRNAFGTLPVFPSALTPRLKAFASSASNCASLRTQSLSETRTRRGGLRISTGARSLYALGATPPTTYEYSV